MSTRHGPDLRRPAVVVAIALPVLLAVVVAVLGLTLRGRGTVGAAAPVAETGPLAVAPVGATEGGSPGCASLLAALPPTLPGDPDPLPARPIAAPSEAGIAAWAAAPRPVVLRCGLPRPAELVPTSPLTDVNGVSWLALTDNAPDPALTTYIAVDRPVYVALTVPATAGSGPLQAVSDAISTTLPKAPVVVR
ncbi:MAG: DUF3515 domain-containing protein [Pseudonocardia sp.]|nr:DUF3515 domain-containing protein [Pseudonocardia sp.]